MKRLPGIHARELVIVFHSKSSKSFSRKSEAPFLIGMKFIVNQDFSGRLAVYTRPDEFGNRARIHFVQVKKTLLVARGNWTNFGLLGDVTPANMRTTENASVWLPFGSADHHTAKANEKFRARNIAHLPNFDSLSNF